MINEPKVQSKGKRMELWQKRKARVESNDSSNEKKIEIIDTLYHSIKKLYLSSLPGIATGLWRGLGHMEQCDEGL
jgi:hypothetical protein